MRPLENPVQSIDFVKVLLWLVAGLIVASVVYLTVLERTRDFAVFKATGVSTAAIGAGICLQAVIVAVLASVAGVVLAIAARAVASRWTSRSPAASMVQMPVLAVVVGRARRAHRRRAAPPVVAPATAFGGP